jgi:nitroimidazol reductase NimA-like FMN-containing flavoprotein (pyridoxamine 5'-phosphate oxidase superfamily)
MFRELLRKNKRLDTDTCIRLLREQKRGVLSVIGDHGYPYGMPMNHFYNPEDRCIYFHCGRNGHRLDSLKRSSKASFCVCEQGYKENGDWAYHVRSVIVFGEVEIIDDIDVVSHIARKLSYKFTHDEAYIQNEIDRFAKATLLLKLTPEHVCGKFVKES